MLGHNSWTSLNSLISRFGGQAQNYDHIKNSRPAGQAQNSRTSVGELTTRRCPCRRVRSPPPASSQRAVVIGGELQVSRRRAHSSALSAAARTTRRCPFRRAPSSPPSAPLASSQLSSPLSVHRPAGCELPTRRCLVRGGGRFLGSSGMARRLFLFVHPVASSTQDDPGVASAHSLKC